MPDRRNILFIVIDQLRADCVDGGLAAHVALPNLRALQAEGVWFANHHSVAAPCGPARAALLTGQYAMNHRAVRNGTPLPADRPNLATEMRRLGYEPLLYGYTDITRDPRRLDPGDPALRTYEEVLPGFREVVEMRLEQSWPWRGYLAARGYDLPPYPDIFRPQGDRIDDPALYAAEDSDTAYLTDRFLNDIFARPPGWFAHLTYIRPHPPLVAPAPYNRMYDPARLPAPLAARSAADAHPFDAPAIRPLGTRVEGFPDLRPDPRTVATLRALYFGLATEVDTHIGRVLDELKARGLYDDTLIVVTGDHGEMLGDRGLWGKETYHDAAFRVPLIIRDARLPGAGGRVEAPTESVDVAPTLLDLVGADIPDSMDGCSLRPFLEGQQPARWRSHSWSEIDFGDPVTPTALQTELGLSADQANLAILRTGGHTLVHFGGDLPQILFDRDGAGEDRNIADDPGSLQILLDLSRRMLSHRMVHAEGTFARTMVTGDGVKRRRGPG